MLLAASAVLLAAVMALTGSLDLMLYGGPALLVAGLLTSGRFIGEERILARRATTASGSPAGRAPDVGAPAGTLPRVAARTQPAAPARPARAHRRLIAIFALSAR